MKRFAVAAALAVSLWSFGPVPTGGAQDSSVLVTITSAYTASDPSVPAPISVCLDDDPPQIMELGDQLSVEGFPGLYQLKIFYNDGAACSDVPDEVYETSVYAGDHLGLVIAENIVYSFPYDDSCVPAGDARLTVASALYIGADVYLQSQASGEYAPFALGLVGGASSSQVTAGTYDLVVVDEGSGPDGTRLLTVPDLDLGVGTYTQVFLAGIQGGTASGSTEQQAPGVCDDAEPPPEETTTSTTTTTTASTTTTAAVAPAAATPATPVTGTTTYTG